MTYKHSIKLKSLPLEVPLFDHSGNPINTEVDGLIALGRHTTRDELIESLKDIMLFNALFIPEKEVTLILSMDSMVYTKYAPSKVTDKSLQQLARAFCLLLNKIQFCNGLSNNTKTVEVKEVDWDTILPNPDKPLFTVGGKPLLTEEDAFDIFAEVDNPASLQLALFMFYKHNNITGYYAYDMIMYNYLTYISIDTRTAPAMALSLRVLYLVLVRITDAHPEITRVKTLRKTKQTSGRLTTISEWIKGEFPLQSLNNDPVTTEIDAYDAIGKVTRLDELNTRHDELMAHNNLIQLSSSRIDLNKLADLMIADYPKSSKSPTCIQQYLIAYNYLRSGLRWHGFVLPNPDKDLVSLDNKPILTEKDGEKVFADLENDNHLKRVMCALLKHNNLPVWPRPESLRHNVIAYDMINLNICPRLAVGLHYVYKAYSEYYYNTKP